MGPRLPQGRERDRGRDGRRTKSKGDDVTGAAQGETVEAVVVPTPAAAESARRFPRTAMDPDGDGIVNL
jgi:hypothetical protein